MKNDDVLIDVKNLEKTYTVGLRRRKVHAVRGISFQVKRGEIFGIVGPNGAGKTSTIKIITGLMRQTAGEAYLFGHPVDEVASRRNLGYLPEGPYFYEHLKVEELLLYYAQLHGISRAVARKRADELIERVGLDHARGRPLKKFSKGMRQRAGLAQALINDPELVILDEPQSGLDPIGRKEVRDLIFDLKQRGKTVVFSSHILPDVEAVCDRVALFHLGELMQLGALHDVMNQNITAVEVLVSGLDETRLPKLERLIDVQRRASFMLLNMSPDFDRPSTVAAIHDAGGSVVSMTPQREDLEQVFIRDTQLASSSPKTSEEEE